MAASNIVQIIIQATDSASGVLKAIGDNSDNMSNTLSAAMNKSTRDMNKAQTAVVGLKDNMVSSIGSIKGLVADFGMVGIGASIVKSADNWAEAIYKLRRSIGGAAEDASQLMAIGKYAGIGTEEASMYFAKFGKAISTAKDEMQKADGEGKQSGDVFSRLGISFAQLNNKNVGEVFTIIAEKMRGMADGADKDKVSMELFGKSGMQVAEMLNMSKEQMDRVTEAAQKNGLILNDQTVDGWHNLSKEMADVTAIGQKWAIQIGNDMLPALKQKADALKSVTDGYSHLSDSTRHLIGDGIELVGEFAVIQIAFKATAVLIGTMAPGIAAALTGPWGALILVIGLAIDKVYEYLNAKNKVDSYDKKAEVYDDPSRPGMHTKKQWVEHAPTTDQDYLGVPGSAGYERVPLSDAEEEEQGGYEYRKQLPPVIPSVPTTEYAAPPFEEKKGPKDKIQQDTDEIVKLIDELNKKIFEDTGTAYQVGIAKITESHDAMLKQIDHFNTDGIGTDVTDKLWAKELEYEASAAEKVKKVWREAWTDIKNQTKLIGAQLINDKKAENAILLQIELDKIEKERVEWAKKIKVDPNDTIADNAANNWASKASQAATKKGIYADDDDDLKQYQQALQYDQMRINLIGQTQSQVDAYRQKDLAAYADELNRKIELASNDRDRQIQLQNDLNNVKNQQYQLDANNYDTAFSVAIRNIQNQQTNYAQIVEQAWNNIYANAQDNLDKMALKGESCTKAIENFFQNMMQSIEEMFIKMWADKTIMGPLQQIFSQVIGGNQNPVAAQASSWSAANGGAAPTIENGGLGLTGIGTGGSFVSSAHNAGGGDFAGGYSLVGEEGPELAYFGDPSHIYTANQSQQMLNPSAATITPNVNVTVINKSGQQVSVSQQASYDPGTQSTLLQMVVDGVQNNMAGSRDFFFGRG